MKRVIKEIISGILLVASLLIILLVINEHVELTTSIGISLIIFLVLVIVFFGSMIALIHYSKTGSSVEGSEGEWTAAGLLNPSVLLFRDRSGEEAHDKIRNQRMEDEYNDRRDKGL